MRSERELSTNNAESRNRSESNRFVYYYSYFGHSLCRNFEGILVSPNSIAIRRERKMFVILFGNRTGGRNENTSYTIRERRTFDVMKFERAKWINSKNRIVLDKRRRCTILDRTEIGTTREPKEVRTFSTSHTATVSRIFSVAL